MNKSFEPEIIIDIEVLKPFEVIIAGTDVKRNFAPNCTQFQAKLQLACPADANFKSIRKCVHFRETLVSTAG